MIKPGTYIVGVPGMFFIKGVPYVLGSEVSLAPGESIDPVLEHLHSIGALSAPSAPPVAPAPEAVRGAVVWIDPAPPAPADEPEPVIGKSKKK